MINISIIIPIYNVEKYIEKCISSVYNQGLVESEFEVIVVDDESPDNSLQLAMSITKGKTNVKFISQQNQGLGGARNTGIRNASGKYILFLDSDDWLVANSLKNAIDLAIKYDLDILEFAAQGIDANNRITYQVKNKTKLYFSGYSYYREIQGMNSACNKLYRHKFIKGNEISFLEKTYIEDFEFNSRCFSHARKIMATDLLVGQFFQSSNSITRNTDSNKRSRMLNDILKVLELTKKQFLEVTDTSSDTEFFYKERMNFLVATFFYQLIRGGSTWKEINFWQRKLESQELFYCDHRIKGYKKNMFRILVLKNLKILGKAKQFSS